MLHANLIVFDRVLLQTTSLTFTLLLSCGRRLSCTTFCIPAHSDFLFCDETTETILLIWTYCTYDSSAYETIKLSFSFNHWKTFFIGTIHYITLINPVSYLYTKSCIIRKMRQYRKTNLCSFTNRWYSYVRENENNSTWHHIIFKSY